MNETGGERQTNKGNTQTKSNADKIMPFIFAAADYQAKCDGHTATAVSCMPIRVRVSCAGCIFGWCVPQWSTIIRGLTIVFCRMFGLCEPLKRTTPHQQRIKERTAAMQAAQPETRHTQKTRLFGCMLTLSPLLVAMDSVPNAPTFTSRRSFVLFMEIIHLD